MEEYCKTSPLFYMCARTEWLLAEEFENIDNWDDSLKPSASHYIKQAEEWITSMMEHEKIAGDVACIITTRRKLEGN